VESCNVTVCQHGNQHEIMTQGRKKTSTLGTLTGNIRRKIRKRQSQRHEDVQYNPNGSQDGQYGRHWGANMSSSCPLECSRAEMKLRNKSRLQMHTYSRTHDQIQAYSSVHSQFGFVNSL